MLGLSRPFLPSAGACALAAIAVIAAGCWSEAPLAVGDPCTSDTACGTGFCLSPPSAAGWTDGYCTADCTNVPCEQGTCVGLDDHRYYCLAGCRIEADCRSGYVCSALAGVCLPDCRAGWSCGSALLCDAATGACVSPQTTAGDAGASPSPDASVDDVANPPVGSDASQQGPHDAPVSAEGATWGGPGTGPGPGGGTAGGPP